MLALFPICLLASTNGRLKAAAFGLFGFIAVVEHSYWATVLKHVTSEEFHRGLLVGQMSYYVFLALQLALLTCYAWLLFICLQRFRYIESKEVMRLHAETAETVQV
jgi:hypothetical protein